MNTNADAQVEAWPPQDSARPAIGLSELARPTWSRAAADRFAIRSAQALAQNPYAKLGMKKLGPLAHIVGTVPKSATIWSRVKSAKIRLEKSKRD